MVNRKALEKLIAGQIRAGFNAHEWSPLYVSSAAKRVAGSVLAFFDPKLCRCAVGIGTVHRVTTYDGERGSNCVNETWRSVEHKSTDTEA